VVQEKTLNRQRYIDHKEDISAKMEVKKMA